MAEKKTRLVFESSCGKTFLVRPVSDDLPALASAKARREFESEHGKVEAPTYEAVTVGGETQVFTHDETSVSTDEEKAAWAEYVAKRDLLASIQRTAEMRAMLLEGLDVEEEAERPEWAERLHRRYDIPIPDDPDERMWLYISKVAVVSAEDALTAIHLIQQKTLEGLVTEEAISAAMDSFRNQIQRQAAERIENSRGKVDGKPEVQRSEDGQGVEGEAV